jgi:hypothetical protein
VINVCESITEDRNLENLGAKGRFAMGTVGGKLMNG